MDSKRQRQQLTTCKAATPLPAAQNQPKSPFAGYYRTLSAKGGWRIDYTDQVGSLFSDIVRCIAAAVSSGFAGWWLLFYSPFSLFHALGLTAVVVVILWLGCFLIPIRRSHSIEVHPDGLIIDDRLFFSIEGIGENWPTLQVIEKEPDRRMLQGIYGTRFVDYAPCNRVSPWDATPEVLAADLKLAMAQMWGRRDVNVPLGPME